MPLAVSATLLTDLVTYEAGTYAAGHLGGKT
jgi:hypothetical protein